MYVPRYSEPLTAAATPSTAHYARNSTWELADCGPVRLHRRLSNKASSAYYLAYRSGLGASSVIKNFMNCA